MAAKVGLHIKVCRYNYISAIWQWSVIRLVNKSNAKKKNNIQYCKKTCVWEMRCAEVVVVGCHLWP